MDVRKFRILSAAEERKLGEALGRSFFVQEVVMNVLAGGQWWTASAIRRVMWRGVMQRPWECTRAERSVLYPYWPADGARVRWAIKTALRELVAGGYVERARSRVPPSRKRPGWLVAAGRDEGLLVWRSLRPWEPVYAASLSSSFSRLARQRQNRKARLAHLRQSGFLDMWEWNG